MKCKDFSGGPVVENPPANAGDIGDVGLVLESRRPPAGGNDNLRPYTCLKNLTGREAWQAKVHGVAKETGQYP